MNILAFNRSQDTSLESDTCKYASLDEVFANSDIISLHCPLTPETEGLINSANIGKMKDGVIIINTSRGPLIVEQDLADALNSGKVAAAAVDVVSKEPILAENPLLHANNCIITPHIAWAPIESRSRLMEVAVGNLAAFLNGSPLNVVNH
jgi:glycerate dehydrogenase